MDPRLNQKQLVYEILQLLDQITPGELAMARFKLDKQSEYFKNDENPEQGTQVAFQLLNKSRVGVLLQMINELNTEINKIISIGEYYGAEEKNKAFNELVNDFKRNTIAVEQIAKFDTLLRIVDHAKLMILTTDISTMQQAVEKRLIDFFDIDKGIRKDVMKIGEITASIKQVKRYPQLMMDKKDFEKHIKKHEDEKGTKFVTQKLEYFNSVFGSIENEIENHEEIVTLRDHIRKTRKPMMDDIEIACEKAIEQLNQETDHIYNHIIENLRLILAAYQDHLIPSLQKQYTFNKETNNQKLFKPPTLTADFVNDGTQFKTFLRSQSEIDNQTIAFNIAFDKFKAIETLQEILINNKTPKQRVKQFEEQAHKFRGIFDKRQDDNKFLQTASILFSSLKPEGSRLNEMIGDILDLKSDFPEAHVSNVVKLEK